MLLLYMNSVHLVSGESEFSRDRSRARILETARMLCLRDGYDRLSVRKLATELQCAVGTIYVHFSSKDVLLESLAEQSCARLHRSLQSLCERHPDGDPVILLKKVIHTIIDFFLRHPEDYRLAWLPPSRSPGSQAMVGPLLEVSRRLIQRGIHLGRIRDIDMDLATQAAWASVHGLISMLMQDLYFPNVNRNKLIEQVVTNCVDSLVVEPAPVLAHVAGA